MSAPRVLAAGLWPTLASARTCESLATAPMPDTTITVAQLIQAGTYTAPDNTTYTNLPAFCRVAGYVSTVPGENVGIEVWPPITG